MSALDLSRYETTIRRCVATLLHASYTDGIPTETTDAWRTFAADASRDLTAIVTRLRAAEALRDDLRCEVEALQAERDTARLEAGRLRARLRAAEARTAWQPIETAPMGEWVAVIDGGLATTGACTDGEWWDRRGVRLFPTAWEPLPAAPEAP